MHAPILSCHDQVMLAACKSRTCLASVHSSHKTLQARHRQNPIALRRPAGSWAPRCSFGSAAAVVANSSLASEGWPLWSALAFCAAISQVVERRTPFGAVLSPPLVSMLVALGLAVLGIIPTSCAAYDAVWTYLMPLAAALTLLQSDLRRLWSTAASTLVAFLVGAAGTLLGTVVAFWLLGGRLGADGYKVAAALCASYIGGSVNFAAVAQSLGLPPGPLLAGAMTADNMAMAAYIAVIMSIPAGSAPDSSSGSTQSPTGRSSQAEAQASASTQQLQLHEQRLDSTSNQEMGDSAPILANKVPQEVHQPQQEQQQDALITAETAGLGLAAASAACMLGSIIAGAAGFSSGALGLMAVLASCFAMAGSAAAKRFPKGVPSTPFAGAEALGSALMMLFFATIGAGAGSLSALRGCGWLLAFIAVQLSVHLAVCLGLGRALRLPMRALLIASNANVGGSATAAAMASSKHWHDMVQPAMLTGSLGYAIATGIGTCMGHWLRTWAGAAVV